MTPHDRDDDAIDPRVRALYREASTEDSPVHLDDALRAAARRDARAAPQSLETARRRRTARRWWPLAAAATIGAVAIGIVDGLIRISVGLEAEADLQRDLEAALA